jgi:DNA-directed RNA polymerase
MADRSKGGLTADNSSDSSLTNQGPDIQTNRERHANADALRASLALPDINLTDDEMLVGTVFPIFNSGRPHTASTREERHANADALRASNQLRIGRRLEARQKQTLARLLQDPSSDEEGALLKKYLQNIE